MFNIMAYIFIILASLLTSIYGQYEMRPMSATCSQGTSLTFSRISGESPRLPTQPVLMYMSAYGSPITAECYNRCRKSEDCLGFIVDYAKSCCFKIPKVPAVKESFYPSPGVAYFSKVCIPLPGNCSERAWSLEVTPEYELLGLQHTVIPNIPDIWSCAKLCLEETTERPPCLSANYHSGSGTCTLSSHDRWTDPDSFIPTTQRSVVYYIENHCLIEINKPTCWHDPVYNETSLRADLQITNVTRDQCETRCENERYFECRAFSYLQETSDCLLHSDTALINLGPQLSPQLVETQSSEYSEMIPCLNMTVSCGTKDDSMSVTLHQPKFQGRLFVQGHADSCWSQGKGSDSTTLVLPLPDNSTNRCNLNVAYSVGEINRTLASAVVVVQNHPLIQTVSDRVVKVTCLISESATGPTNNLTLATGLSVLEPGIQNQIIGEGGNVVHNGTSPRARMRIIDQRTGKYATNIRLGDPLQLVIDIEPPFNVNMVRAGHLIASSGSHMDSLLLLDFRGCPPDLQAFPGLVPINETRLAANFRAFRFPSSPILTLSIVLTICSTQCQPTDCGNGVISYGRRRRSINGIYEEVPLQLAIMVHSENGTYIPNPLLQPSFGASSLNADTSHSQVCTSFITACLLALFGILLQFILLAVCCCVLHKKSAEKNDTISLRHDF
ncbi:hypothetical protein O3M35_001443 [Rhynocoris fuscipes]|uniref:Uncharacterized protein n=1 Tax=Rhynocoris fuscipes TaxID=488301 RepID=A0AAW1CNH4_9HEMI